MTSEKEILTEQVRVYLTRRAIARVVALHRTQDVFMQSQTISGYGEAAESAHRAFWRWVEREIADLHGEARACLNRWLKRSPDFSNFDWAQVPPDMRVLLPNALTDKQQWIAEFVRQETLVRVAQFSVSLDSPARQDPDFYKAFAPDMWSAEKTDLKVFFHLLAKPRRPTTFKSLNDRTLALRLLLLWVPDCFWAISTGGVVKAIAERYPRGGLYHERTVAKQVRAMRLWRLPKPIWWGIQFHQSKQAEFIRL